MHKVHNDLADFDLETLEVCTPEALQAQSVTAVLLALGSNYQAEYYLPRVRKGLAMLGDMQLSTAFQNPDFTSTKAQPKPDYTNQCVYLSLRSALTLQQLQQTFKQFERDCNRQRLTEPTVANQIKKVTMDIDILMVKPFFIKNSLSQETEHKWSKEWIIMADRYPFRAHEKAGVKELITSDIFKVG